LASHFHPDLIFAEMGATILAETSVLQAVVCSKKPAVADLLQFRLQTCTLHVG